MCLGRPKSRGSGSELDSLRPEWDLVVPTGSIEAGSSFVTDFRDRDYWVEELNTKTEFKKAPPTYARTVQWLKHFARLASDLDPSTSSNTKIMHANLIAQLTAHSCRVTLLMLLFMQAGQLKR